MNACASTAREIAVLTLRHPDSIGPDADSAQALVLDAAAVGVLGAVHVARAHEARRVGRTSSLGRARWQSLKASRMSPYKGKRNI